VTEPGVQAAAQPAVQDRAAHRWRAYAALALGVFGIAWAAIFVKWAGVPGPASAFYRVLMASVVLVPWQGSRVPQHLRTNRPGVLLAVAGGTFFALDLALWNTSLLLTSAANSTLLVNTTPLWVGLGTLVVFHERLPRWFWIGMALALGGAALILGGDMLRHPRLGAGDLLALGASVFYATYLMVTQRARATLDTPMVMLLMTVASTAVLFILCLALRIPLAGYPLAAWLSLAALALVAHLGGVLLINYALGQMAAAIVSVSLLAQPVLAAVLAVILLGEGISVAQVVGGALVLGGIYLVHRKGL
jgi:drug/metabolite transporter (DMT)-like permease